MFLPNIPGECQCSCCPHLSMRRCLLFHESALHYSTLVTTCLSSRWLLTATPLPEQPEQPEQPDLLCLTLQPLTKLCGHTNPHPHTAHAYTYAHVYIHTCIHAHTSTCVWHQQGTDQMAPGQHCDCGRTEALSKALFKLAPAWTEHWPSTFVQCTASNEANLIS